MKTRQDWKEEQRKSRREIRRLCNRGLATPIVQASSFALLAQIHDEPSVIAEIESVERAIDLLDNTFRGIENQGYVNSPASLEIYTLRPCTLLSDLASENNPLAESLAIGMNKAENEARSN